MGKSLFWTRGLLMAVAVVYPAQVTFAAQPIAFTAYPTSLSQPDAITAGPDGNVWFADHLTGRIGRITTAGVITVFPIPSGSPSDGITAGPDGNLWFTGRSAALIGRITPAGAITEFPVSLGSYSIAAGPDGNLWFTTAGDYIGRITTTGVFTLFSLHSGSDSIGITAGPDGNLWFTESSPSNAIGRITPAGVITEFPIPTAGSVPYQISAGPDGNLWFVERFGNKVGRITPTGVITEFSVPTGGAGPQGITAGPDGNLWFAEFSDGSSSSADKIGRITPAGVITEFFVTAGAATPLGITTGPDGNLWITDGNDIVKATLLNTPLGTQFTVYPNSGGNSGSVTVQIFGNGLQSGASVTLTGSGPDIVGGNTTLLNGSVLQTTFNLAGASSGARTVVVANPSGTPASLAAGFTVTQGGSPQVWTNLVGRTSIRISTPQTYWISYGNNGNVDALGTKLIAYVPTSVAPNLLLGNSNGVVTTVTQGSTTLLMFDVGRVPASSVSLIPLTLTAGGSQPPFQLQLSISGH